MVKKRKSNTGKSGSGVEDAVTAANDDVSQQRATRTPEVDDVDVDDDDSSDDGGVEVSTAAKNAKNSSSAMDGDDEDDDDELKGGKEEKEEGYTGWGSSKQEYYDADMIENEEDAFEEEEEAKKIQTKQLQSMQEDDFGIDFLPDSKEGDGGALAEEGEAGRDGVVTEVLPELNITDDMSVDEKRKILSQRYPEFETLAKDFIALQATHQELSAAIKQDPAQASNGEAKIPLSVVQFRALTAYLGAIGTYFFLLTSPSRDAEFKALPPAKLRAHPVMEMLSTSRKQWELAQELANVEPEAGSESEPESESESVPESEPESKSGSEESETLDGVSLDGGDAGSSAEEESSSEEEDETPKVTNSSRQPEKPAKRSQTEPSFDDLADLVKNSTLSSSKAAAAAAHSTATTNPKKRKGDSHDDSDYGDETHLSTQELAEKAAKKKSLRFYTSQIAQKANKRGSAGRDAGGDTDIPYRERLKDRQARLLAQAEKRGREAPDAHTALDNDSDEEDRRVAKELRGEGEEGQSGSASDGDDGDYYNMVAAHKQAKKAEKKERADAYAEELQRSKEAQWSDEEVGPNGKRAITYAIRKNKGLAPKRKKEVRNPRVKKRKKFDEKQKKLGSVRQLYKGGEERGGYSGEKTGIKPHLVKSVKL